jgi:hypothetical protein
MPWSAVTRAALLAHPAGNGGAAGAGAMAAALG